jgi:hypothetical protein
VSHFKAKRGLGALWGLALEPKVKHEWGAGRQVVEVFFDACAKLRLPPSSPDDTKKSPKLLAIDESGGWVGNLKTFEIMAASDFKGDKKNAAWLPNQLVAMKWQSLVKGKLKAD